MRGHFFEEFFSDQYKMKLKERVAVNRMRNIINNCLKKFDLKLMRHSNYEDLFNEATHQTSFSIAQRIRPELLPTYFENITESQSQLGQDLLVLSQLDFKKRGYFVEFGATDGITLSNSYLLEKKFGWQGILSEPAKKWHGNLIENRSAHISFDCVWKESEKEISFNETLTGEFSTIDEFSASDIHASSRKQGRIYNVKTISLNDLLDQYNAPKTIDYLSIDTEGSEFEILNSFDFNQYKFRVITCEHNYSPYREKIFSLLTKNKYKKIHEDISKFDDWYVFDG